MRRSSAPPPYSSLVIPRSAGLFTGSLLSSRYSVTRPTRACQARSQIFRPAVDLETAAIRRPASRTGVMGRN